MLVIPLFYAVINNSTIIRQQSYVRWVYNWLGVCCGLLGRQANLEVDLTGKASRGMAGVVKVCTASMQCLFGCCGKAPLWDVGAVSSFLYSIGPLGGGWVQAFVFFRWDVLGGRPVETVGF
jgi:hypothetical protein